MKQLIILFLITLINQQIAFGQDDKLDGIFAFVYNPLSELPDYEQSITNRSVSDVFDKLVNAKGVKSILKPRLIITDSESVAAWAHPSSQIIGIEQKAIDICLSMKGDSLNALAALLSHELIHYYEKHDWHNHFAHQYSMIDAASYDANNGKVMEMEADDMGGILAHMAGYDALGIMPKLLQTVYSSYGLDADDDTSYPNLENRIKMAEISKRNLSSLIPLFDAANYLAITGEVEMAAKYLEFIVSKSGFVSRDILNNLGVFYAIAAYDKRPDQKMKYIFPFQLDFDSRLRTKGINDQSFDQLLSKAEEYFKSAQTMDNEYSEAYINLASLYALKGEYYDAEYQLHKLKGIDSNNYNVNVIKGLISVLQGINEEGIQLWNESSGKGNLVARRNLEIMNGSNPTSVVSGNNYMPQIDNIDLNKLYAQIALDKITPSSSLELSSDISFYTVEMDHSEIYIHMDYETDERFSFFHIIKSKDDQLPMAIGALQTRLIEEFGNPDVLMSTGNGAVLNYKSQNMIAVIKDNRIAKWCIYKQQMEK